MEKSETEQLSEEVEALAYWFDKPVAIQIRNAAFIMDAVKDPATNEYARVATPSGTYGQPTLLMQDKEPASSNMLCGVMRAAPGGKRVTVSIRSPVTGSRIEIGMRPEQIEFLTLITELPTERKISLS